MTVEERHQYQDLRARSSELRERLQTGNREDPMTRAEAVELLGLVDAAIERMSPERWDLALEAIVEEAARRVDLLAARRG